MRGLFYELPASSRGEISGFLSELNAEIVKAKAMFLAYEDPFEKYRALLFEYAHTLGHAVEAWLAGVHLRAAAAGIDSEAAVRNHGQCVGMAVIWAGEMSRRLGALTGDGYTCHQAMVYLFNSFGGFSFGPVRALADALGITKAAFLEEVLAGVRLDNKRGYVECADCSKSVDQLVARRPGQMLRSENENAEVRYLVLVEEAWQRDVLESAFDCEFDNVARVDPASGAIRFTPLASDPRAPAESVAVARALRTRVRELYECDESMPGTPAEVATRLGGGEGAPIRRVQSDAAALYQRGGDSFPHDRRAADAASAQEKQMKSTASALDAMASSPEQGAPPDEPSELLARDPLSVALGVERVPHTVDIMGHDDEPAAKPEAAHAITPEPAAASAMRRAYSEAMAMDTIDRRRQRQRHLTSSDVQRMRDFSHLLPAGYREKYLQWRQGKPDGAKGEPNRPSSFGVTLVYDDASHASKWELHLMPTRRCQPRAYEPGYATWKFAAERP